MSRATHTDMCEGPLLRNIIKYAVPLILTGVLQLLFNAADLVVVGQFCGSNSVAAVGATSSLVHLIVNFFVGFSTGAGVAMAQAVGSNDAAKIRKTVHTAMPVAIISGVILTVVGVLFSHNFLSWMGTPLDIIGLSETYLKIYFYGAFFNMIFNFGASLLRAAGDTKNPLYILSIAGVANVLMNVLFVTVFHMDVAGVALATALSQVLSAVLVVVTLMHREDGCHFDFASMRIHMEPLKKIITVGLPAGIQASLFSISNVLIQSSINSFGASAVSGNSAAANIEGFVYMAMNAFHHTALNFTGQNIGAKKYNRLTKILLICVGCVALSGILVGGIAYLFAKPLLSIYIVDSAVAIDYGIQRMTYICLTYFTCGIMDVMNGTLRGRGKSLSTMIITVVGVCGIRVVFILTLFKTPFFHSLDWLFMTYPISWVLCIFAQVIVYVIYKNKLIRSATAQPTE